MFSKQMKNKKKKKIVNWYTIKKQNSKDLLATIQINGQKKKSRHQFIHILTITKPSDNYILLL